ncbi:MAG: hypothetical protein AAFP87_14065 [Pseudomonadota bacterium]
MDDFEDGAGISAILLGEIPTLSALTIALVGMILVATNLKRKGLGFSANGTRAFAVAIFLPTIIILASETEFSSEAVAAILGGLAGYIFSRSEGDKSKSHDDASKPEDTP